MEEKYQEQSLFDIIDDLSNIINTPKRKRVYKKNKETKHIEEPSLFDNLQGDENEKNRDLSELGENIKNDKQGSNEFHNVSLQYNKENQQLLDTDSREMGIYLSTDNNEYGLLSNEQINQTSRGDGIRDIRFQRSHGDESKRNNGYGDSRTSRNKLHTLFDNSTDNLQIGYEQANTIYGSRQQETNRNGERRNRNGQTLSNALRNARDNQNDKREQILDYQSQDEVYLGSLKDRFNKNYKAIKLLKQIEQENRQATSDEQHILNKFSGWGGIPQIFDSDNKEWLIEYANLRILLDDEYTRARNSTLDAFYTPKIIIDTMYKALDRFGFNNNKEEKEIFEPSAGIGAFLSYHKQYADNYKFTCTELDSISARILKQLYPNQKIYNTRFENYPMNSDYDAFIGNPPFGQKRF